MMNWGIRRTFRTPHTRRRVGFGLAIPAATVCIVMLFLANETVSTTAAVAPATGISAQSVSDDTDTAIAYTGDWRQVQTVGSTGNFLSTLSGPGSARFTFTGTEAAWVGRRGPSAGIVDILLDGVRVTTVDTYSASPSRAVLYSVRGLADAGHTLELRSTATRTPSSSGSEISVDTMTSGVTLPPAQASAPPPPYGVFGRPLDVAPDSRAAIAIRATVSPSERAELGAIASRPLSTWFGDWNTDVQSAVHQRVADADARGAVASLVMYNIPHRDCGDYSANSPTTAEAYRQWAREFVAGLGSSRHIVIIEPDALSLTWCLTTEQRLERFGLISYAVSLVAQQGSWSYIDAGHNQWLTAEETAARLTLSGVVQATGFSLNVSNFKATDLLVAHGTRVSALINNKHFVIDTSRNGRPLTSGEWCNPLGMALGPAPTVATMSPLADAYLWIKAPGESDGPCNGGPPPGDWFASYALGLVRNAAT